MKLTNVSISFFALVIVFSCGRKVNHNGAINENKTATPLPVFKTSFNASDTLLDNTDTILYYQRSACFGFCPTFNYTVFANGIVRYNGQQHVDRLGNYYALATDAWWDSIKIQMRICQFFELKELYPVEPELYIPDLPNTIVLIKELGLRKKVTDNHHAPKPLKDFEIFLEEQFKKLDFVNTWD